MPHTAVAETSVQMESSLTDLKQHYASHLARVDENNNVVATEDIVNERGVLLLKKGARVSANVAENIVKHKLLKPLQRQVDLNELIDTKTLAQDFKQLFLRFPDLKLLMNGSKGREALNTQIESDQIPRLIRQNLTVLADQKTDVYEKALFCAALSVMVASELALSHTEIQAAFLAGLTHDIGLLHIDPAILNKKTKLEPEEWRAIKSHVIIGKMILEEHDEVPREAIKAVLEHHERSDGAGYPSARLGDELGLLGQIVGIADALQAIRVNQFEAKGLNLANAVPFLQMNSQTHHYRIYEVLRLIIKQVELEPVMPYSRDQASELLGKVIERSARLFAVIDPLAKIVEFTEQETISIKKGFRTIHALSHRVMHIVNSSGILRMELVEWLQKLNSDNLDQAMMELHELDLMQKELKWQLNQATNVIRDIVDEKGVMATGPMNDCIEPILKAINF